MVLKGAPGARAPAAAPSPSPRRPWETTPCAQRLSVSPRFFARRAAASPGLYSGGDRMTRGWSLYLHPLRKRQRAWAGLILTPCAVAGGCALRSRRHRPVCLPFWVRERGRCEGESSSGSYLGVSVLHRTGGRIQAWALLGTVVPQEGPARGLGPTHPSRRLRLAPRLPSGPELCCGSGGGHGTPHPQVPPLRSPGRCQWRAPRVLSQVDTRARAWVPGAAHVTVRDVTNVLRERTTHIRRFLVEGNSGKYSVSGRGRRWLSGSLPSCPLRV